MSSTSYLHNYLRVLEEQIWAARLHINTLEAELAQVRARIVEQEQAAERTLEPLFQLDPTSALALHDRERDVEEEEGDDEVTPSRGKGKGKSKE